MVQTALRYGLQKAAEGTLSGGDAGKSVGQHIEQLIQMTQDPQLSGQLRQILHVLWMRRTVGLVSMPLPSAVSGQVPSPPALRSTRFFLTKRKALRASPTIAAVPRIRPRI